MQRFAQRRYSCAHGDRVSVEPTGIDFQNVSREARPTVSFGTKAFHTRDGHDAAASIDEGGIQIDRGVFHPHRNVSWR